jgi:integrase
VYGDVSLADARERRDAARKQLAKGIDPGENRKATKAAARDSAANSFEVLALEALNKRTFTADYRKRAEAWLRNNIFPYLGTKPVADLKAKDFLEAVRKVEQRDAIESAHRILQLCSQVMRYAVATQRAERDPIPDLRGALPSPKEKHHAAITDPKKIGEYLRAIDAYKGYPVTQGALQLGVLTFVRPGELRHAEWAEIDLERGEWNIPASKMKMREAHLVPLSRQAVAVLKQLQPLTGTGRYVFPSARTAARPMSDNAVLSALRRMGFAKDEMSGHGVRAMARTVLDEVLQFRPDFIEHQLAHAVKDPNGRAYNRTTHLAERKKMMQTWADWLDARRDTSSVVVPFSRKAS